MREQGWTGLRDIQARAVPEILQGESDVLIAASTAAGKTEAAFLPVLSAVADEAGGSLSVLYVAPLKALINDQFGRLDLLCERLDLPLVRWHGDAPAQAKTRMLRQPRGLALITPESIEALFCRNPQRAQSLFGRLRFIIIDEVHAFLAGPRGLHLASLLRRMDVLASRPARRIGLSATLGDMQAATTWLRPAEPGRVRLLRDRTPGRETLLRVHGYLEPARPKGEEGSGRAITAVAGQLLETMRGKNGLVFAGRRQNVEILADLLRLGCESRHLPNEFFPHHGSLSKELREELEQRLKQGALPTTAICTSTLELGIDIGAVAAVGQVGAPRSIASLRQRLGRSGRRAGQPAILRVHVIEEELSANSNPLDMLRQEAVRAVAAIHLLSAGFVEAPGSVDGLGSGLLHQILSVICQRGGVQAGTLHRLLCGPGPFAKVDPALFMALLRSMGSPESALIEQSNDGTLMLAEAGERLTGSRDFYALFSSSEEWRIVTGGKALGTLPIQNAVLPGNLIVFAGRRWIVREVDEPARVVTVDPHKGGRPPNFDGTSPEPVDDRLAAEMLAVYGARDLPAWADQTLQSLLSEGRKAFLQLGLDARQVLRVGRELHLFTWRGSRSNGLLAILLGAEGFSCWPHDVGVVVADADASRLAAVLARLQAEGVPDLRVIAADLGAIATGKYDALIGPQVLRSFWALGVQGAAADVPAVVAALRLKGLEPEA